jgi:hypothetical protein
MSPTADPRTRPQRPFSHRYGVPIVALLIGIAYLVAGLVGHDHGFGVTGLIIMVVVAAVLGLGGRYSETLAGLVDRKDERINQLDSTAAMVAGVTVLVADLLAFIVDVARGHDGMPYAWLAALGGATYLGSLVFLRLRR